MTNGPVDRQAAGPGLASSSSHSSSGMKIRPGNPEDGTALARLIAGFQPVLTLDPSGRGAEAYMASVSAEAEREYLESARYSYLIAEDNGKVIGFIAMRDKTHLFHLFVAAEDQRKGVARALWSQARDQALRDHGRAEFTVNSSLNAVPVYERFGFVAEHHEIHAHGIAFIPMRARLEDGQARLCPGGAKLARP